MTYSYNLWVVTQKEDSLFIIFQGEGEFPLPRLLLKKGNAQIGGEEREGGKLK